MPVCLSVCFSYVGDKTELAKKFWSKCLGFYRLSSTNLIGPKGFPSTGKDGCWLALKLGS